MNKIHAAAGHCRSLVSAGIGIPDRRFVASERAWHRTRNSCRNRISNGEMWSDSSPAACAQIRGGLCTP